jgi:hypothetical protein
MVIPPLALNEGGPDRRKGAYAATAIVRPRRAAMRALAEAHCVAAMRLLIGCQSPPCNSCRRQGGLKTGAQLVDTWIRVNDPSAGSPTER